MITLQAPWPQLDATSILPNPQLADLESKEVSLNIQRTMGGKKRTYVRDAGVRLLTYSFKLTRQKSFELQAFISAHYAHTILLTNHLGEIWLVTLKNNPFEFGSATGDTIRLDFEGKKQ